MDSFITRIEVSLLILFFVTLAGVTGVHINTLSIPPVIQNGSEEFVTLDCDYSLDEAERIDKAVVVKWFFNKTIPVYQWIATLKPQALGPLTGKLNLEYKASQDEFKKHRALQILQPSTTQSGEYLCKVSTYHMDAVKTGMMIVFAPEKEMGMKIKETKVPGFVNISCWALGVFPEPRLTLYYGQNKDQTLDDLVVEKNWNESTFTFDIKVHKVMEDSNISISSPIDCELSIINTQYSIRRTIFYEPGSLALRHGIGSGAESFVSPTSTFRLFLTMSVMMIPLVIRTTESFPMRIGAGSLVFPYAGAL